MKKAISIFSIIFILSATTVFAHNQGNENQCNANNPLNCPLPSVICDNGEHIGNPHCISPSPTTKPSDAVIATPSATINPTCSPTPTIDEDSPTAGISATNTPIPTNDPTRICLQQGDEDVQISCPTITPTNTPTPTNSITQNSENNQEIHNFENENKNFPLPPHTGRAN